ncbi:MAG TPA: sensor domain-containing diguanylate cyclase [Anaerolineales bacterium]|nr:sensor domain-containing diguanylate cyclase [Anaerolineales bacterium]
MKNTKPVLPFAPHEIRRFISPMTAVTIVILAGVIMEAMSAHPKQNFLLAVFGVIGIAYLIAGHILIVRSTLRVKIYKLMNSMLAGTGLGILAFLLPENLGEVTHILIIFSVVVTATTSGRFHAYLILLLLATITLPMYLPALNAVDAILEYTVPFLVSIVVLEVIMRIIDTTQQHIQRLEMINKVSRQIMQTLDMEKTISLLKATIQDTLDADTYFIGIVRDDQIQLEFFCDNGKYFNEMRIPIEGTLSGWVIKNQKELFLPDMREKTILDGVDRFITGKERASLSWIGVPLKAENVTGVLALASYTANAFDHADLELLTSLGQHITLALDNTIRHAQVERQARLDSLTGVYNHGYFLKVLTEQADEALRSQKPLSLIMLDIDYFKQYNDTYGHLVGDRILNSLCTAIQHHIKQTDAVGRWGGEEFVISLPGANGTQALHIARRINETMRGIHVVNRDQQAVPIPTVSQGIAVFPNEADEIYRLIDVADKRLYVAKERGRNQIEPGADFWKE